MFGHYHLVNPVGALDYSRGSSALWRSQRNGDFSVRLWFFSVVVVLHPTSTHPPGTRHSPKIITPV